MALRRKGSAHFVSEAQILAVYSGALFMIFTGVLIWSRYRRAIKRRLALKE
jgi:hypothetical protein